MKKAPHCKNLILPRGYKPCLNLVETEAAIKYIKDYFQTHLAKGLNLIRVSAPLMVLSKTGINDNLSGIEKPIGFNIKDMDKKAEIIQSLAKWKRAALADYGLHYGEGLYTDMNAIRPDEILDNLHSIYVDQWDWERVIHRKERTLEFLKYIVRKIYRIIRNTEVAACRKHKKIEEPFLPKDIHFIHSEDLLERYPGLSPKGREDAICKDKGAVFIIGIGMKLKDGRPHDGRAADYDDWFTETESGKRGLNGDIIVWYPPLNSAFELSSMGIRVDKKSLVNQCKIKGEQEKLKLPFHRRLIKGELPLSIGGGIGQSRLCMFYLRKAHIGEAQSSIWPAGIKRACRKNGITLL